MPSPSFIAAGTVAEVNNTTAVSRPSVSAGDLMLLFVVAGYSNSDTTVPAGWTLIQSKDFNAFWAADIRVYWKIASGSEPASYNVTIANQPGGNNVGTARILTYGGVDQTTPVPVSAAPSVSSSASVNIVCPSVTTTTADTTLVCFYSTLSVSSATFTPSSGMENRSYARGTSGVPWAVDDVAVAAAGATGTKTATASGSVDWMAISFAIASAAAAGATFDGMATATSAASGNLTTEVALSGTATAASSASGTLQTPAAELAGVAVATSNAAGVLTTAISLAGTASATSTATGALFGGGVLTTRIFKNNTGMPRANLADCVLNVYNATTGALVVRLEGLTTNADGRLIVSDMALAAGVSYAYEADFSAAGLGRRLPTAVAS